MLIERSDKLAEEVLREFRKQSAGENKVYASVTPYENGREKGHVLHVVGRHAQGLGNLLIDFTYSENRNSDDVVLYRGDFQEALKFASLGLKGRSGKVWQKKSDEMYAKREYFKSPALCAASIFDGVRQAIVAVRLGANLREAV
jgi:hypothetical protein